MSRIQKRTFIKSAIAVCAGLGAGVTKFVIPEAKATMFATNLFDRQPTLPQVEHEDLNGADTEALFNAVLTDPQMNTLRALSGLPLTAVGPLAASRIVIEPELDCRFIRTRYVVTDGEDSIVAHTLFGMVNHRGDIGAVKEIILPDAVHVWNPITSAPMRLPDDEHTRLFINMLFGEPEKAKVHVVPSKKGPVDRIPPCTIFDKSHCAQYCNITIGWFGIGLPAGAIGSMYYPGSTVLLGGPAWAAIAGLGGFAGACINCNRQVERANRECCDILREQGGWDLTGLC